MDKKLAIFFDTNIALHFQRLDQVDWQSITQYKEIDIIVSSVVLSELDKNKSDNSSKKLRSRASEYGAWLLKKYASPAITDEVKIVFLPHESLLDFSYHALDRHIADDRLIASIIEYSHLYSNEDIKIFTADFGLTIKLKTRGFSVQSLPDSYRIPETVDNQEIEIRQLKTQLAKYANRLPKITLSFVDAAAHLSIEKNILDDEETFVLNRLYKVKRASPSLLAEKKSNSLLSNSSLEIAMRLSGPFSLSDSQKSKYEEDLKNFYLEYERYLHKIYAHTQSTYTKFEVQLLLSNLKGTAPANNVEVFLKCEHPFSFLRQRDISKKPEEPSPPKMPTSRFDFGINFDTRPALKIDSIYDALRSQTRDPNEPTLQISSELTKLSVPCLKHRQELRLIPIWLDFANISDIKNTQITYEVHANELVDPLLGTLNIRLKN